MALGKAQTTTTPSCALHSTSFEDAIRNAVSLDGSELTQRLAIKLAKPFALFETGQPWFGQIENTQAWLSNNLIYALNIAGPSEERHPGIYETTLKVLDQLFSK